MRPDRKNFNYAHLPPHLQSVSALFGNLVDELELLLPECVEKDVTFRKLLEAKDAAVRARLEA